MNSKTLKEFYNLWVKPIIKNPITTSVVLTGLFGASSLDTKVNAQNYRLDWINYDTIKVTKENFGKGIRDYYKTKLDSLNLPDSIIFGIADSVAKDVFHNGQGFNIDLIREGSIITIPKIIFTELDTTRLDSSQIPQDSTALETIRLDSSLAVDTTLADTTQLLGQGILPDTIRTDSSIAQADTIIERLSPIKEFTTKYDSTKIELLKQTKAVSNLNQIVNSFYELAGDPNNLKDDNIEGLLAAIEKFNETYTGLDSSLYVEVSDSLSKILKSRLKSRNSFAKNYSKLIKSVKNKFGNSITNLENLLEINNGVNQNLEGFTQIPLTKLKFEPYDTSFKNLTLEEDILINENKEITQFTKYLQSLNKDRKEILATGMGDKIIATQNIDLKEMANFYEGKRNVLNEAISEIKLPHEKLVKKQIRLIDNILGEISDITGTEYKKISKTPKLKHEKLISFLNGIEVGTLYLQSGVEGQILKTNLGNHTPLIGLNLISYGNISLTLDVGYKTAINSGETITYGDADPITGITPFSKYTWGDNGSDQVGSADLSLPITENLSFNIGALGTSEDHNISGKVKEYISVPGMNPILTNTYDHAPEKFVGNNIYGTLGTGINFRKFNATAKTVLKDREKPGYSITIGYRR